jgi:uncharacterized protein YgiM (DUF1202 family)
MSKEMRNVFQSSLIIGIVLIVSAMCLANPANSDEMIRIDEPSQIIVTVTGGRVRSEPSLQSEILKESTIGTRFTVLEEKNNWSRIQLTEATEDKEAKSGWISNTITTKYDASKPGLIYQQIVDKYFQRKKISFSTAAEIYQFLPRAADEAKSFEVGGDLRLKQLIALASALKAIPFGKSNSSPYKEFLSKHKADIIYSEPAGEWYVRSENFWALHQRYKKYRIGETIAWTAAGNPTAGECEGYINCHLYRLRITQGEYLNFYPNGKHSLEALQDVYNLFQPIVADLPVKRVYYTASDISDRAEFNSMLADLRKIISKSPHLIKTKILKQINQIAEGHR